MEWGENWIKIQNIVFWFWKMKKKVMLRMNESLFKDEES